MQDGQPAQPWDDWGILIWKNIPRSHRSERNAKVNGYGSGWCIQRGFEIRLWWSPRGWFIRCQCRQSLHCHSGERRVVCIRQENETTNVWWRWRTHLENPNQERTDRRDWNERLHHPWPTVIHHIDDSQSKRSRANHSSIAYDSRLHSREGWSGCHQCSAGESATRTFDNPWRPSSAPSINAGIEAA